MAQEILVVDKDTKIFVLVYPVAPIVIGGAPQVLRLDSTLLPLSASLFMGNQMLSDIDNGLISYEAMSISKGPDETAQEFNARLKKKWTMWSSRESVRIEKWANQLANIRWIDVG